MAALIRKSFDKPDEVLKFPKAKVEVVDVNGLKVRRLTVEPGWIWSKSVGPIMETDRCPFQHAAWIVISGRFTVKMEDGTTETYTPGDIGSIPPNHDTWVDGDESVIGFDFLK